MTFRMTPQRMAILDYLSDNRDHPSAEDIYREVREDFPTMSLATVYNTLELLRNRGDLLELTCDPGRKRYDSRTIEHHHLVCRSCGRIVDIDRSLDVNLTEDERQGFVVEGNHVEFYGTCSHCHGKEMQLMAKFVCEKCGAAKEGRCKPKKCPACGEAGAMQKES